MNHEESLDELTPEIQVRLGELAQRGNMFQKEKRYKEAIQAWDGGKRDI